MCKLATIFCTSFFHIYKVFMAYPPRFIQCTQMRKESILSVVPLFLFMKLYNKYYFKG